MFRLLREILRAILGGNDRYLDNGMEPDGSKAELVNQLRIMYGRGEISREIYRQLRLRLHWNQIGKGDLMQLHQGYLRKLASQGRILEVESPDTRRLIDRLHIDRVLMEEAVENIAARQKTLSTEREWLNQQAESARNSAQKALPDESLARSYLEVWHDLQTTAKDLADQQTALEHQRAQLETQAAELKAAVTRLKLLQSREHLAELSMRIRRDLLPQVQKRN